MTELSPAEVIRRHVAAFNARDLDALMAGFTDDAAWVTGVTALRGRDELTVLFRDAMTQLLPSLTIDTLLADGNRVACQLTETLTANGERHTFPLAGFYQIRGGRIATAKIYREGTADLP
ncbi:hypothetical protein ALI144C_22035 [Actinosynnema sp. ALI-1.44]|uniref:nuclear transport factor 2 family protein n=1 Tax=Actinosynnema sp. ALI-1.44 TaxID=1933779 RepID=UPI00097BC0E6|nr:nuclear transport factor 2 family protein [Actinosynnema sp. ALI-1.44]ONI81216.1 hypothetical protein ALI144C_22035 [Actinosynnema sp. ALI-1.44]